MQLNYLKSDSIQTMLRIELSFAKNNIEYFIMYFVDFRECISSGYSIEANDIITANYSQ